MINSSRQTSLRDNPLNLVMSKLFNSYGMDNSILERLCDKQIRARILPKPANKCCAFAPDTISWFDACALNQRFESERNQTMIYPIPLLGVTNRSLAGYQKSGFNLFRTLIKLTIPANVRNFDQCTIEFGSRLPISITNFQDELYRQICLSSCRVKTKGNLCFYAHGHSSIAATTDLEALRLSALKAMPVINIDWLDSNSDWEKLWNPCADLAPIKSKLETKLIDFIDKLVAQVCASRCNAIIKSSNCFLDSTYLPYRKQNKLPDFNKVTVLPSMQQVDRCIDPLDAEYNLLNYLSSNLNGTANKKRKRRYRQVADEAGWMPAIL